MRSCVFFTFSHRCCDFFFFQAEDGIRDLVRSRGLGDVYKRQGVYCDVTDADAVQAAVDAAEEHFGKLNVLYNNAGISMADDDGPTSTSREAVSYTHLTLPTSDLV